MTSTPNYVTNCSKKSDYKCYQSPNSDVPIHLALVSRMPTAKNITFTQHRSVTKYNKVDVVVEAILDSGDSGNIGYLHGDRALGASELGAPNILGL